jgi:hypothetical protein
MGLFLHTANNRLEDDILITPYIKPLAAMMCGETEWRSRQYVINHPQKTYPLWD